MKIIYLYILILFVLFTLSGFALSDSGSFDFGISEGSSSPQSQTVFNPLISVIVDLAFDWSDKADYDIEDSLKVRSIDLNFSSSIDVYARADVFFTVERSSQENTGDDLFSGYVITLEEGYITFLTLPLDLQLRLGKMRTKIGKVNTKHLHALNWYDYPVPLQRYFGTDGLAGLGGELSWMLPLSFYTELSYQLQKDESDAYFSIVESEWYHNIHLKSFFELGEDHSLEIGFSSLFATSDYNRLTGGEVETNGSRRLKTASYVFDFTYLWRPAVEALYQTIQVSGEAFLFCNDDELLDDSFAAFIGADYRFSRRWSLGCRYDYLQEVFNKRCDENHYSVYFTYAQSEYAFLRGGYEYVSGSNPQNRFFFQLNFGIGPHRAHQF